jgi:hypothetical protein
MGSSLYTHDVVRTRKQSDPENERCVKTREAFNKNYHRIWQTKLVKMTSKGLQRNSKYAEPTHKEGERYDRE